MTEYDRLLVDDYVRTGEAEVIILHDNHGREDNDWQRIQIQNCLLRSRNHSYWQLDPVFGSIMIRQRWITKTERQPKRYISDVETQKWMPTQRYFNTSHVGPFGHTTKNIIRGNAVGAMFIHFPYELYPGYRQYYLDPKEGNVRLVIFAKSEIE
ncbi:hypothetical protein WR25_19411 [Diploscapter pachys]|uniref:Glycosyltransferase family 92 protein n=1 Tax=Diploscapter pachys TaxID=2018661 RepID=A0A2A2K9C8_9BILA|nr:hypothetical protein WR25_19411 [Diploscapter pachys]